MRFAEEEGRINGSGGFRRCFDKISLRTLETWNWSYVSYRNDIFWVTSEVISFGTCGKNHHLQNRTWGKIYFTSCTVLQVVWFPYKRNESGLRNVQKELISTWNVTPNAIPRNAFAEEEGGDERIRIRFVSECSLAIFWASWTQSGVEIAASDRIPTFVELYKVRK